MEGSVRLSQLDHGFGVAFCSLLYFGTLGSSSTNLLSDPFVLLAPYLDLVAQLRCLLSRRSYLGLQVVDLPGEFILLGSMPFGPAAGERERALVNLSSSVRLV